MRQIKSKGMRPELAVRRLVHGMGYRYRLHVSKLPGKPDLVFSRRRKIIEVRGCFWHQHRGCVDSRIPKSRREYWGPKLAQNVARDEKNEQKLTSLGWTVLVVWECDVSDEVALKAALRQFLQS